MAHTIHINCVRYGRSGGELYSVDSLGLLKKWSTQSGKSLGSTRVAQEVDRFAESRRQAGSRSLGLPEPTTSIIFSVTESTRPSLAFCPAPFSLNIVDLENMHLELKIPTIMLATTCAIYDGARHIAYCGGTNLRIFSPPQPFMHGENDSESPRPLELIDFSEL